MVSSKQTLNIQKTIALFSITEQFTGTARSHPSAHRLHIIYLLYEYCVFLKNKINDLVYIQLVYLVAFYYRTFQIIASTYVQQQQKKKS